MSYLAPAFRHPNSPVNEIGHTRREYEGGLSTLCAGCGHDSISAALIQACFELSIPPHRLVKLSGIGCSSKTPAYFLSNSHGFNSVHGRMPSVATGANLAQRGLVYIGVSGDGDSASIGLGQFAHIVRRNVDMLYIVENNGCYGLTKGQDSATADVGSRSKAGAPNAYRPIELCAMALQLGCDFVGRGFSGDKDQLVPMIKAGLRHRGLAFLDILSPCVTFNNNPGSTKSYEHVRAHAERAAEIDWVPGKQEISVAYEAGSTCDVTLHDGSVVRLEKLGDDDPAALDRRSASARMQEADAAGRLLTGLLFIDERGDDLHRTLNTGERALNALDEDALCPGSEALEAINERLR